MMKMSRILLSIAIINTLSTTVYSSDDDRMGIETARPSKSLAMSSSEMPTTSLKAETKTETKAQSSRGFLKTLIMGTLMLSSPAVVEATNPGFLGCYTGTANGYSYTSNNISISTLTTTNWNYYSFPSSSGTYNPQVAFYPNKYYNLVDNPTYPAFSFKIECEESAYSIDSYCKNFYIKTAFFCRKIFDINYYASMIYGVNTKTFTGSTLAPSMSSESSYYLTVWDSLSPNNTQFDKYFSGYLNSNPTEKVFCNFSTPITPSSLSPTTTAAPITTHTSTTAPAPTPQKQNPPFGAVI